MVETMIMMIAGIGIGFGVALGLMAIATMRKPQPRMIPVKAAKPRNHQHITPVK